MKKLGTIMELFISKEGYDGRLSQSELALDTQGVFIDKFYNKNENRSILITSIEAYKKVQKNDIEIDYGELGENILIDFDLSTLQLGMQLCIGKTIIEITQPCTLCDHLAKIDPEVPTILSKDRGIFAKALQEGMIQKGDSVYWLKN